MMRNERSTSRRLPGLSQALSWLRQGLPPAERPPLALVPAVVPARIRRRRPTTGEFFDRGRRDGFRPD
jgi:hypothetical protein